MADITNLQQVKKLQVQINNAPGQEIENGTAAPVFNAPLQEGKKGEFEKRPVVQKKEIVVLPVQISKKNLTAEEHRALQQHYDAETYEEYKTALKKVGVQIPDGEPDLEKIVELRSSLKYGVSHEENGEKIVNYFWKDTVSEDTQKMVDWAVNYTIVHDKMIAELKEEVLDDPLPIRTNYDLSLKDPEKTYEFQGRGTNNCFCCAGAAMINQYLKTKGKEGNFTQNDMRKYRSVIKKYDPSFAKYKQEYEDNIRVIDSYAGEGKDVVGNVFQMGDFFFENLPGQKVALNKMNLTVPPLVSDHEKRDERIAHNVKATFMDTVYKVLSTGNVVSFLETNGEYGHYLTITGIKGDKIEYLDSMIENPAHRKQTGTVEGMLHRLGGKGMTYELAWLSDMDDPEELTAEYSNLNYDEKEGFSLKHMIPDNVLNPMHTRGLEVRKEPGDRNMLPEGVAFVTYIPNPLKKIPTETFKEHAERRLFGFDDDETQIEEPKKEEIKKEEKPKQEIKKEEPKKKEEKKQEVKKEEPKKEEPKKEEQKKEEIKQEIKKEEIKQEAPKQEEKKKEAPKQETVPEKTEAERRLEAQRRIRERGEQMRREASQIRFVTNREWRSKAEARTRAAVREAAKTMTKKEVLAYEKKSKNYEAFGVGFHVDKTDVNAGDSEYMQSVKLALKDYLGVRQKLFEKHGIADVSAAELAKRKEAETNPFSNAERKSLGESYDVLQSAIRSYRIHNGRFFKFGRGAARMRQVKQIEEKIQADNKRFALSKEKRVQARPNAAQARANNTSVVDRCVTKIKSILRRFF